jgi:hypothetical protein
VAGTVAAGTDVVAAKIVQPVSEAEAGGTLLEGEAEQLEQAA